MKYLASLALLFLLLSTTAFATDVCGNASGTWNLAGSPYIVTCNITVQHGDSLAIEPGVRILFSGHYRFIVNGLLTAVGTQQDSIVFTRQFPQDEFNWLGIRFYDSSDDNSRLEYCVIEHSVKGDGNDSDANGGGILCEFSSPTLAHCTIQYNTASRGGGLMGFGPAQPTITGCLFAYNQAPYCEGGGAWIGSNGGLITNSTFIGNSPSGVYGESEVQLTNTIIAYNNGVAISGTSNVSAHYSDFYNNQNGTGSGPHAPVDRVNRNGDSCDVNFNLTLNPMFVDLEQGNLRLRNPSPCIDAGDPTSPHDPDGSLADIGAFPRMPSGDLRGIIRVHSSGLPLPGVAIFARGGHDTIYSTADGSYILYLDPGTYSISYRKNDFCDSTVAGVVIMDTIQTSSDLRMKAPSASASVTSLSLMTWPNQSTTANFFIRNQTGNCPLHYSIADTSSWLSTEPSSGSIDPGESQIITVTCNGALLPPGADRQTAITISHSAVGDTIVIPLELVVQLDVSPTDLALPTEFALHPNFPNPFNASTSLNFDLPRESSVRLEIFNVNGQVVATPVRGKYPAGRHSIRFTATDLPSGMYLVRMEAGDFAAVSKMILLK